jgi:general stress protein 26
MDKAIRETIQQVLDGADDMTVATLREDGFPQATTVSFVNDGLTIYFGCGAHSQKARNIARDNRVSLTVNLAYRTWEEIRGVSLAGLAERVTDPAELARIGDLMLGKFPRLRDYAPEDMTELVVFRITPKVISVLDYTRGFGHTDLVAP